MIAHAPQGTRRHGGPAHWYTPNDRCCPSHPCGFTSRISPLFLLFPIAGNNAAVRLHDAPPLCTLVQPGPAPHGCFHPYRNKLTCRIPASTVQRCPHGSSCTCWSASCKCPEGEPAGPEVPPPIMRTARARGTAYSAVALVAELPPQLLPTYCRGDTGNF